eukprot:1161308-Pelagomonas_calceolata.AAC.7
MVTHERVRQAKVVQTCKLGKRYVWPQPEYEDLFSMLPSDSWAFDQNNGLWTARLSVCSIDRHVHLHLRMKLENSDFRGWPERDGTCWVFKLCFLYFVVPAKVSRPHLVQWWLCDVNKPFSLPKLRSGEQSSAPPSQPPGPPRMCS